jgi:hypothetical protein
MKRSGKKSKSVVAPACVRPLVIGDVVEYYGELPESIGVAWRRLVVSLATINLDGLKPKDFGKTWRWIQTDEMPNLGGTVEVFRQNTWRPFLVFSVARTSSFAVAFRVTDLPEVQFTAADEGPRWRWPVAKSMPEVVVPRPVPSPFAPELKVGSRIELRHEDGSWRPAEVNGLYDGSTHPLSCVEDVRDATHFNVVGESGTMFLVSDEGKPNWRWPGSTVGTSTPEPANSAFTIPLKNHLARMFAIRLDEAIEAATTLNRVRALRLLSVRVAHDMSTTLIEQAACIVPLQDVGLIFSRNAFFAGMEATEQLQKQNATMQRSVLRLNDSYVQIAEQLKPLVAAAELHAFIRYEIVAAKPELAAIWQYLLLEWEALNPQAVQLARFFANNPTDSAELSVEKCFAVAK